MWTEMPQEILIKVFMCLNVMDLITGVSRTCSSWRSASKDPKLWRKIDSTELTPPLTSVAERPYAWSNEALSVKITKHLNIALSLSCGAVSYLIFSFSIRTGSRELVYIAMRTPKLRRVVLPAINRSNMDGFVQAVKHWKYLECVTLPCAEDQNTLMRALGKHCKRLTHLKLVCPLSPELGAAIAAHLPGLKALSLRYTLVYEDAVLQLLASLGALELLNLCHVIMLNVEEPLDGRAHISLGRHLGRRVVELATRLGPGFVTCRNGPCVRCDGLEAVHRSYETEEDSWRYDEVPEFRI